MRKNRSTAALSVGMYCRAGCTEIPSREHTPAEALASLGSNPDPKPRSTDEPSAGGVGVMGAA